MGTFVSTEVLGKEVIPPVPPEAVTSVRTTTTPARSTISPHAAVPVATGTPAAMLFAVMEPLAGACQAGLERRNSTRRVLLEVKILSLPVAVPVPELVSVDTAAQIELRVRSEWLVWGMDFFLVSPMFWASS